jgi:hypothetical protein
MTLTAQVAAWIAFLLGSQASAAPWRATLPETAEAIATVAEARPLPGSDARQTAGVLTIMAFRESAFRPDAVGDGGAARGEFQIHASTIGHPVPEGIAAQTYEAADLLALSFRVCSKHPLPERLAQYMWGRDCEHRLKLSRARMAEVARLLRMPAP